MLGSPQRLIDIVDAVEKGRHLKQDNSLTINAPSRRNSQSECDMPPKDPTPASSPHISYRSAPNTPFTRTGPPRSLSFSYNFPNSPGASRKNTQHEDGADSAIQESNEFPFDFKPRKSSDFRDALEYNQDQMDRKGKRKDTRGESRLLDDSWNPIKWFHESPKEEKGQFDFGENEKGEDDQGETSKTDKSTLKQLSDTDTGVKDPSMPSVKGALRRAFSESHSSSPRSGNARARWGRLRSLLPSIATQYHNAATSATHSTVTSHRVNITDELITGGLSTLMLRLWLERDEKNQRRIPILLHRLRIRVSDSLHPLHGHKSVFRIECEYANGAARWVIYRQLRDFISLHTHYAFSNAYNRNVDNLPEFPKTSLPYFKFLNKESKGEKAGERVGQADFALMQREALENYLIDLIRAVMFHPASNRLAGFLEISALFISLAQSGGSQSKAGYLQIEAAGSKGGGFGRKSASRKEKREYKWCAVRESYLVVLVEPGELDVWDVFLLDSEFKIERPKRYYRQGLNLLHPDTDGKSIFHPTDTKENARLKVLDSGDRKSIMGSVRSRISKVLHLHDRHEMENKVPEQVHGDGEGNISASNSSIASRVGTPMLDPSTNANPLSPIVAEESPMHGQGALQINAPKQEGKNKSGDVSKHTFYVENSQTRLKLFARNERQMLQWITALEKAAATSHYAGSNRFDSFAPIRLNVAAQWLVDGRDYFWNLSRAILLAKETIYIHDWWLSPELLMRRPNKDRYRLDRLLERKAKEGVQIFIILYQEVSNKTTPTDSNYAKQRLTGLHPNVMVQRSPSHFQTGTFYWAHHEKMCVIDQAIAFMGGLDLCFGRWDTAQHVLTDDIDNNVEQSEIWPGKDYSNPRLSDFHNLSKPEEDMYDRTKVPRMPWHDVGMQVVGQPARDLARHFIQRWNYLLRIKNHTRVMPFLLPPPEFKPRELMQMGLTGTCEMQVCRSAGPWSLGTPSKIEHSIQNAYLKAIQLSEHFVYIENQFFITSTVVNDVKVENRIGDALVHRIIRAHREGTPWKCCIVIPLLPGFTFPIDYSEASAIRIILECQNCTIARGPNSIFSRLRKEGIDPDEYISVFSLRNWAKLRGDVLTTEMVYIHGKVCIVDDRLAIIGSANINERSQRGDRDSELAAIIRDTDMIDCTMAGKPFKVGRFAHTLRVRLMREHLGVDVDGLDEADLMASEPVKPEYGQKEWDPESEQEHGKNDGVTRIKESKQRTAAGVLFQTGTDGLEQVIHGTGDATSNLASKVLGNVGLASQEVNHTIGEESLAAERTTYTREGKDEPGFASAIVPTLEEKTISEHPNLQANGTTIKDTLHEEDAIRAETSKDGKSNGALSQARAENGELFGAPADASKDVKTDNEPPHARSGVNDANDDEEEAVDARATIRRHLGNKFGNKTWTLPTPTPKVDPDGFEDPISDAFWNNVWVASAVHNTEIFRKVFHAIPDDLITTWKQYKDFVVHHERLNKSPADSSTPEPVARMPSEAGDEVVPGRVPGRQKPPSANITPPHSQDKHEEQLQNKGGSRSPEGSGDAHVDYNPEKEKARKPAKGIEPFEKWEREEMEKLLKELCGHLVVYPNRFLEGEDIANNFLFNADRMMPLPIYD